MGEVPLYSEFRTRSHPYDHPRVLSSGLAPFLSVSPSSSRVRVLTYMAAEKVRYYHQHLVQKKSTTLETVRVLARE